MTILLVKTDCMVKTGKLISDITTYRLLDTDPTKKLEKETNKALKK